MTSKDRFTLYHLFPKAVLFPDENGDGYPDQCRLRLEISPGLTDRAVWAGLLNLSARCLHAVLSIDPPLIRRVHGRVEWDGPRLTIARPGRSVPEPARIRRLAHHHLRVEGFSGPAMGTLLMALALSDIADVPPLPEGWAKLLMSRDGNTLSIVGKNRQETGTLRLPSVPDVPVSRHRSSRVSPHDLIAPADWLYAAPDPEDPRARPLQLVIGLSSETLSPNAGCGLGDFIGLCVLESTAIHLPIVYPFDLSGVPGVLTISEAPKGEDHATAVIRGNPAHCQISGGGDGLSKLFKHWRVMAAPSLKMAPKPADRFFQSLESVKDLISGRTPRGTGKKPTVRTPILKRRASWENEIRRMDRCIGRIENGTGPLDGRIFISRNRDTRDASRIRWETALREKGYTPRLQVLNAFKPGFSWLLEAVLPALLPIQKRVDRASLTFRPWSTEEPGLEMRSRWLQECYPGPDLVARKLGWPPERIRFHCDPHLTAAYRFQAWDEKGKTLFDGRMTPFTGSIPYIGGREGVPRVHPTRSGARIRQDGHLLMEESIPTDRERFWRILQDRWLPELEDRMALRRREVSASERPVFWEEVRLDVAIDESDERLDLGQERICPMEALHEDIYFGLLDFFEEFCSAHAISGRAHFGRILPMLSASARGDAPSARLTVRSPPMSEAAETHRGPLPQAVSMAFSGRRCTLTLTDTADDLSYEKKKLLCRTARSRGYGLTFDGLRFHLDLPLPAKRRQKPARSTGEPPHPPMDHPLGFSEADGWCERLKEIPHLAVYRGGRSLQGRPIPVVEATLNGHYDQTSMAKTRALKPTLLMVARHHANEPSSTNAALALCWRLSRTGWGREMLRRVNLVSIPMENPDGVATYETLLPGCEDHMLHAARYNALGVEWYADYLSDPPRFPEASVKTRLWHRWMPEYVLDAHGVPNHEWAQPFGGYLNHRFREYWIPRAFLFVILPFINDPEHPGRTPANRLADAFAENLSAEKRLQEMSRSLKDRYRRYARAFAPETFPGSASEHLEIVPPAPRLVETSFAHRAWPITRNEIVSEVVDEGADGDWLETCVRAHLKVAETLLTLLREEPLSWVEAIHHTDGSLELAWRKPK